MRRSFVARRAFAHRPPRYEAHGSGPVLFLGFPITLGPLGDPSLLRRYLDGLTDRYRVVVMDYPPTGSDANKVLSRFTPNHVFADIVAVANAVGADRFAWYGYSWGGLVGLQLAARTDRLTALLCGGFPPLGLPYADLLSAAEAAARRTVGAMDQLMVTFFHDLEHWRDREALVTLTCPRMAFAGSEDVVVTRGASPIRIGPLIAQHRAELEQLGWTVRLLDGYRHDLFAHPDVVVPLVRSFMDPILLLNSKLARVPSATVPTDTP
jgi:pimeloyl-ACP methyl ester carboxylesterase